MKRTFHLILNYGVNTITIRDKYVTGETSWTVPTKEKYKDDIDKGLYIIDVNSKNPKNFKRYRPVLPLAVIHAMLALCYDSRSDNYKKHIDLGYVFGLDDLRYGGDRPVLEQSIKTAVNHLNRTFDKLFNNIFHIDAYTVSGDQHLYMFSPEIFDPDIEITWEYQYLNEDIIRDFHIDKGWIRTESDAAENHSDGSEGREEPVPAGKVIPVSSATQKSTWKDDELMALVRTFKEHLAGCDPDLLPSVKVVGKTHGTLPDFICNTYIRLNPELEKGRSFVIVDGPMGSGKSYSLYETARRLAADGHNVIAFDLPEVYSNDGTGTILKHIGRFIKGNDSEPEELRLRSLLEYDARKAKEGEKTVFIIDGIDEISSLRYRDFAGELSKIARISNPDIIFILGTRNANDFIKNSGIKEGRTVFRRWVNISLKEIDYKDPMFDSEKGLRSVMEKNDIFRTPLFVSYYREIQALAKGAETDSDRFLGSYGQKINIDKIRTFYNYYDLFYARTELLCAHARKNKINPAWYSAVLPCLAYYLFINGKRAFEYRDIEDLFESPESDSEFEWFNREFTEEFGAFSNLFPDEKLNQLLGTRIVLTEPGEKDKFRFDHEEYKYYLAAMFASRVIRRTDREDIRNAVLDRIDKMTSFYKDNRYGKMLYIPFARYTFMDVASNGPFISEAITASRRGRKPKDDYSKFDPKLYQIAANVSYEDRDVYKEAKGMTENLLEYHENRHKNRSSTTVIKQFEDWKQISNVNVIDYSMITRRKEDPGKWKMLETIESDLSKCATIVLRDAFEQFEGENPEKLKRRGFSKEFPLGQDVILEDVKDLERFIKESSEPVVGLGRFPVDLLGKLISNIGAVKQEKAKYRKNKAKDRDDAIRILWEAVDFHKCALEFREAVVERIDEYIYESQSFDSERKACKEKYLKELERVRMNISTIRSLVTLGTDNYYLADYTDDYDSVRSLLEEAVNDYHNEALVIQGVAPLMELSYDMAFPIERLSVGEKPQVGAEPFVIFRRAAGAYYLLYEKTVDEIKRLSALGERITAASLEKEAEDLIRKQFIYLKGTYIYLLEACCSPEYEGDGYKPDPIRLEINAKEIDGMWTDASKKFSKTLPGQFISDDGTDEGKDLLMRILDMYKELHPLSDATLDFGKEVQ